MTAEKLKKHFENIDEDKRQFAYDAIDEYVFFKERIKKLQELPYIRVHPTNRELQELTPAAKLIKEYSQAVDNKRKTLLMICYRNETTAGAELLQMLEEFDK